MSDTATLTTPQVPVYHLGQEAQMSSFIATVKPHQLEGDAGKQSKLITCQYLSDTIWRLQVLSLTVMSNSL